MPMSDELASASLSSTQKAMEISLELIKMLSPLVKKLFEKALEKVPNAVDKVSSIGSGSVTKNELLMESEKAKSSIISNSNFLAEDTENITDKAKERGIPIYVEGSGEKRTVSFLQRDEAAMNQILQDVMSERMREAPQNVKAFEINPNNIEAMKAEFDKNGLECQFLKGKDDKVFCAYPAKDIEKVQILKQDFKEMHSDLSENFKGTRSVGGMSQIEDAKLGKSITLNDNQPLTKSRISQVCQEQLGYSAAKADLAANKVCDDLKLNPKEYFKNNEQLDMINSMKTNIRYQSDSLLLRDTQFSAVNFKDGNSTHIFINSNGKQASLTPSKMTEQEMKNICTAHLSMTDEQASETVSKAVKIDSQINSKLKETTIDKETGLTTTVEINRTSRNSFSAKVGVRQKSYSLDDPKAAEKISRDFGIPLDKAKNIVDKAKSQSVVQNKINTAFSGLGKQKDITKDIPSLKNKGVKK